MAFKDKYRTKDDPIDPGKKEISNDAYAVGEIIEEAKLKLEGLRVAITK